MDRLELPVTPILSLSPVASPVSPAPNFPDDETLLPAIAQDATTGEVLMIAYMNRDAWLKTIETKRAVYYSRSRGRLWTKGEQSGHVQEVVEIYVDCDADAILLKVRQRGDAACHKGYRSCFYRRLEGDQWTVVGERIFDPEAVYESPPPDRKDA